MTKGDAMVVANIEEALSRTHFGKFNYLIIIFSGVVLKNVILESVGISFALPILECDMQLTHKQQGILGAVCFIGIIASSHLWGFLADTQGRRRIMLPAFLLSFLVTIISSFSPNFEMLVAMEFINGVLLSAGSATIFAYLGEFHSQQYRNRAILSAAFISAFLAIFFPMIAWIFINQSWQFQVPYLGITYTPWRLYMVACGVPGFICGLVLYRLPESPKYLLSVGKADEAMAVLRRMHQINTSGNTKLRETTLNVTTLLPDSDLTAEKLPTVTSKNAAATLLYSMWQQTAPLFQRQFIRQTILSGIIQFVTFFTAHGVYMWSPYMLNSSIQYSQRHSEGMNFCNILRFMQKDNSTQPQSTTEESTCVTHLEITTYVHTISLELIYVVLLLCVSYTIGKVGRKPMLFIILIACGTCGVLGLVIKIPLLAIYFFLLMLCCGLGTTVLTAIVVDMYPTNLRAMAICISLMVGRIGSVTGSNLLGAFIDTDCELALYSSAGSLLIAGFLSFLLPKLSIMNKDKDPIKC